MRKDAAREHQHQQQELLKLREEQAAKLRTKDKEQDTLQASKEALQAKLRAKQFVTDMGSVRQQLKLVKIAQGQQRHAILQAKKLEQAKTAVQRKLQERASFITETDEVELENALRERVQEEVKYDFFIDTPKPNSVRRVSSVLSGFDSIFDRK